MTKYATITALHGQSSFGGFGGVDVKHDDGKAAFLAGSYFRALHPGIKVEVGARVELLEGGRYWTVIDFPLGEMIQKPAAQPGLHPDSHPDAPLPIRRVPRTGQAHEPEPQPIISELQMMGAMVAAQNRANELLGQILQELKNGNVKAL